MSMEKCENCRFWFNIDEISRELEEEEKPTSPAAKVIAAAKSQGRLIGLGMCRRYPPIGSEWPVTRTWGWCGEFVHMEKQL